MAIRPDTTTLQISSKNRKRFIRLKLKEVRTSKRRLYNDDFFEHLLNMYEEKN